MQIRVSAIANWPFYWNVSPNLQSLLVFLYVNSLYASQIFWSLSIAYNEVHLFNLIILKIVWWEIRRSISIVISDFQTSQHGMVHIIGFKFGRSPQIRDGKKQRKWNSGEESSINDVKQIFYPVTLGHAS